MHDGLEIMLPDNYEIEDHIRSFSNYMVSCAADYNSGDDVPVIFDRDSLLIVCSMIMRIVDSCRDVKPS